MSATITIKIPARLRHLRDRILRAVRDDFPDAVVGEGDRTRAVEEDGSIFTALVRETIRFAVQDA